MAHALLAFLLRPEIARRNAEAARLVDPEAADQEATLARLSPQGAYDPRVAPLAEAEWAAARRQQGDAGRDGEKGRRRAVA